MSAGAGSLVERDGAEKAVGFVVGAGREEQGVGRAVFGWPVAELERPESVDRQRFPICAAQLASVFELPVWQLFVGVDLPVAEVADEEIAAEAAEVRRGKRKPPRRVELSVLRDTGEQIAVHVVDVHEPTPLSGDLVNGV